jgi:hypothetical protein
MNRKWILLILVLGLPQLTHAQYKPTKTNLFKPSELVRKPGGIFGSLLDPSKFSMTHSYSISFLSMGNQAFNEGLYLNTMRYRISDPLSAQVQIGYLHQPLGAWGNSENTNGVLFVRSATFKYQPSDGLVVRFDYAAMPSTADSPFGLR